MTDAFATLGLPRAAAMDEEVLRHAYAEKSRAAHPDHGGDERLAADTNAAYETLHSPDKRLKHLLELAAPDGARQWRTVPLDDGMMNLFSKLGSALEASAKLLERKQKAQSALAKALLANDEMRHREALELIGCEIEQRRKEMERQLPALEPGWVQLAAMQAKFAYLSKWRIQVRERLLALM
jgi:curved DNA-binding protein CbpA